MENRFNIFRSKLAFGIVCLVLFFGLFVIKSDLVETRLGREIWNLGHLFSFFIAWMFLINLFPVFYPKSLKHITLVVLLTLISSFAIEIIQHFIGRSASVKDIGLNIGGTFIALSIVILKSRILRNYFKVHVSFFFLVTILVLWPSMKVFIDEVHIRQQFPVLSDFSRSFEISRWSTNHSKVKLVRTDDRDVLKVTLLPEGKYSIVALQTSGDNWSEYTELVIEIVNKAGIDFPITIRVHDSLHNNRYSDRYNNTYNLQPGASTIIVQIIDIYKSPKDRKMDLNNISSVTLFGMNLDAEKELQINKVYLR